MGYRAVFQNLEQYTNSNYHTSLKEELTKQLPLKDRRKPDKNPQSPGRTKTKLLLKYQHQDWMLKE
jgi:hypothetical protein